MTVTLRLGVDVTAWRNPRGDGRFVRNAVARMVALHPGASWTLYCEGEADGDFPPGARVRPIPVRRAVAKADSARGPIDLVRLGAAIRRRDLDAFLSPSLLNWFPTAGVPNVVGLHDANAALHGALVLPSRRARALWRAKQALALRLAARLFTVSDSARVAIERHVGVPPGRLAVVGEAPDPIFAPRSAKAVEHALGTLGLSPERGLFLFSAGLSPHKGLDVLVDAYVALRARHRDAPPLVLVGSHDDMYSSSAGVVRHRVEELGLGGSVLMPGFVDDETLACLCTAATAAVVPSLGEGFGLPAVEAAACGAAVVLSDIGPHRETLGDAALLVSPGDRDALASALERVLVDPLLRRSLGERGREAVGRLSWDDTARALYTLLAEASRTRQPVSAER